MQNPVACANRILMLPLRYAHLSAVMFHGRAHTDSSSLIRIFGLAAVLTMALWGTAAHAVEGSRPPLKPPMTKPAKTKTPASGRPLVDGVSAQSLTYDMLKLITFFEQRGWTVDRYEIEKIMPEALLSVCRCTPAVRAAAVASLRRQLRALGGASRLVWERNGHDTSAVSHLLTVERAIRLLTDAIVVAPRECPYWLEPKPRFRGHQIDTDHVTLNLGGGGLFSLRKFRGRWLIGGGGGGRITASFPIASRWKLRLGPDLGGAALVGSDVATDNVEIDFVTSVPIALRRFAGLYVYDVEVSPLALGMWWRAPVRYGVRLSGLVGVSAPRLRGVLPWTGLSVGLEWVPASRGQNAQWTLRMGLRFGFAIRLWD